MTNEAAEGLEHWIGNVDAETLSNFRFRVNEALAAERRATVERAKADIRVWLSLHASEMSADTLQAYADVDAMFDTMLEQLDEVTR